MPEHRAHSSEPVLQPEAARRLRIRDPSFYQFQLGVPRPSPRTNAAGAVPGPPPA